MANDAAYISTLKGCLENLPTLNSRLVRIFISSTFTDTREERNVLLEDVYPRLKTHCKNKYGMDFQLVDMRWGVPKEAADDHQATSLCLEEIKNCQKLSTGPNFVTFLNQKHGFRPLQTIIPEAEFSNLCGCMKECERDTSLLEKWYNKDSNQVPPVYVLQPVSTHIPGYKDMLNTTARQEWDDVFTQLREDLRFASNICHEKQLMSDEEKHKYYMSVTEVEIFNGILKLPDSAADHCLCFVRIIEDITSHLDHSKAWRFIDVVSDKPDCLDTEAQTILSQLRDEKIVKKLQNFNITRNIVKWSNKDGINRLDHDQYLNAFKDSFFTSMVSKIDRAVENEKSLIMDELYIEVLQHLNMANQRCAMFHGRREILEDVSDYLHSGKPELLVLYGMSGCGKTSIMAQAVKMIPSVLKNATVVVRFMGTSPDSSNLWRLLYSLCEQIVVCYGQDRKLVPEDFDELKDYFLEVMKFATTAQPLVILLDSLDQLSKEHNSYKLNWLPRKLPPNVRLLVSTYTEATDLIGTLRLVFKAGTFLPVPVFSRELSAQVVKAWLEMKNRTLTEEQFGIVEDAFDKCSLPLFVKLTYDQVISWKSYTPLSQCQLSYTIQQSIDRLFSQLEKKHGSVFVTRALAYVTASASGISETELEDLLSLDDIALTSVFQIHVPPLRRIPPLLWVRIRHDISQYLVDKEVDEVRSFFWYHRQFYETAATRYLSDNAFKAEIHSLMADYYLGVWYEVCKPFRYTPEQMKRVGVTSPDSEADRKISAQPLVYNDDGDVTKIHYNKRKLNKLPYHLYKSNRQGELRMHCLFNYKWIQTKLQAVSLQEVILDYSFYGEKDGILHKALKAAKSTLKKFPETVAMEISGRLLALLQMKTDKHETKLLEDSMKASAQHCNLVPYLPCYNIPSEAELYSIEHPKVSINPKISAISDESSHFASLSEDNTILIWDLTAGEVEATVNLSSEVEQTLNVLMKPPGKDVVIVGTSHQTKSNPVFVINLNNGTVEHSLLLTKHYTKVPFYDDLKFNITDKYLFVHVVKQAADVFDVNTGKLLHEFEDQPVGATFACGDTVLILQPKQTNIFNMYNMETFEFLYQISSSGTPKALYLDDTSRVACVLMENTSSFEFLRLAQEDWKRLGQIEVANKSKIQNIIMKQNTCMVSTLEEFLLYDMKTFKKLREIVVPIEFKPSYRVLDFNTALTSDVSHIIAGYDKHLIIWETKSGKLVHSIEATKSRITKLQVAPSGEYLVTTNSRNNKLTAWSVATLKTRARSYQPLSLSNSVRYMCVNRAGTVAVLRSMNSNEFAVIDILRGEKRCEISHDFEAMMPFVTEDGKHAVIREYTSENALKIWDTIGGELVSSLPVSSLHLKGYILGSKPENLVVLTADDNTNEHMLTFYHLPSATETGVKIPLGKYNMLQIFFACNDKYCLVGIEEQLHPGVKIYTRAFSVATGQEVQLYPRMHPKKIQIITPVSENFMGHRVHQYETGEETWEIAVLNIETGQDVVTWSDVPSSVLTTGNHGHYGIDRDRNIFDIKLGKKCFQFDPDCVDGKSTPKAKLTHDEKYALWIDVKIGLVKIGNIETQEIIGKAPIHSIAMNMEVTPQKIVLMGCEDGRIMMLQIVTEGSAQENMFQKVFTRSMKRGVRAKDSVMKALKPEKITKSMQQKSQACHLL